MYLDKYLPTRYMSFSFLYHPGVSMVEGPEAWNTWTSTSCQSECSGDINAKTKNYYLTHNFATKVARHQCTKAITAVRPESSWAFLRIVLL